MDFSVGLLTGDPTILVSMVAECTIKCERDLDLMAYHESMIYGCNQARVALLDAMANSNTDIVKLSRSFLSNVKAALVQLEEFIIQFNVQPDVDERNELKIASKGFYNLILKQLMAHRGHISPTLHVRANNDNGEYIRQVSEQMTANQKMARKVKRAMAVRFN